MKTRPSEKTQDLINIRYNMLRDTDHHKGSDQAKDYFVERDGLRFAGTHLLIELWDARYLDQLEAIEMGLKAAIDACHATLLNINLHRFSPSGGISGVAILAESHMSIHTWPERNYAAIDIFMCGAADPFLALPILKEYFAPKRFEVNEQKRGILGPIP